MNISEPLQSPLSCEVYPSLNEPDPFVYLLTAVLLAFFVLGTCGNASTLVTVLVATTSNSSARRPKNGKGQQHSQQRLDELVEQSATGTGTGVRRGCHPLELTSNCGVAHSSAGNGDEEPKLGREELVVLDRPDALYSHRRLVPYVAALCFVDLLTLLTLPSGEYY